MQECTRCFYNEAHPFGIVFDADGVCSGCLVHEEKDQIDWELRKLELRELLEGYKSKASNYDCLVPVTGGRDSFFIVDQIKNKFGLNPLLAHYNSHFQTPTGIRNYALLREVFDCDAITQTVSPKSVKAITRATLRREGSIYWQCIAGQTVWPVQLAVRLKIPLIIWGAHQGLDQVGMFSHHDRVEMTRKYRKEHDLMGLEAEDLISDLDGITEELIQPFVYPHDKLLSRVGVRGIYLNNYLRWDSKSQHEEMISRFDYETRPQSRTFDCYNDSACWLSSDLHDWIKYLKHGYGKVTDHATRDLRLGHITRNQGEELIKYFSGSPPLNIDKFCSWLGVTETSLKFLIDRFRNERFWVRDDDWNWCPTLNLPFYERVKLEVDRSTANQLYRENIRQNEEDDQGYMLFGKGWPRAPKSYESR